MGKASNAILRGLILQSVQRARSPAVLQNGPAEQVQPRERCPHSPSPVGFLVSAGSPSGRASWKKQAFMGMSAAHTLVRLLWAVLPMSPQAPST